MAVLAGDHAGVLTVDYDDVDRVASALPHVTTGEKWHHRHWLVQGQGFAWERPFSKADLRRFGGDPVPVGPIVAVTTDDLHDKAGLLASGVAGVFTIAHFDNYPAVLIDLAVVAEADLEQLIVEAWLTKAPDDVARSYLAEGPRSED